MPDNKNNDKTLLIVEKSQFSLSKNAAEKNDYVFEGIFAVLGEKNKNHRVYKEDQYLPQMRRMQKEILEKKVWGEANHPENRFDINILNVSHVIEKIDYDETTRHITGTIRVLDTTAGREVKTLVDEGLPIHISSRAAGSVMEDGTVIMKHLFTFDIVHNPGFSQAILNRRINEQFGLGDIDNVAIFEINDSITINNTNQGVGIEKNSNNNNIYNKKELNMSMENNYITEEKFLQYSNYLKNKFDSLNEKATRNNDTLKSQIDLKLTNVNESKNNKDEKYDSLLEYVDYLKNHLNKSIAHNDHIVEYVQGIEKYMSYVTENLDKNIGYVKYLSENVDKSIGYSKYLSEKLNKGLNYSDTVTEGVNELQDEILSNRKYSEYVAEQLDARLQYSEYLAESLDTNIQYSEHIGGNVNESINYTNYLGENVNKTIAYSEYLAENIGGTKIPIAANINVTDENYEQALTEKLDVLVESAKKQKGLSENSEYHFLKFMPAEDVAIFSNLNENMKNQVVNKFKVDEYYSTNDVTKIFKGVINENVKNVPTVVDKMKEHHRNAWNALNENQQTVILKESEHYNFYNQTDIDKFWDSRTIDESQTVKLENKNGILNETLDTNSNTQSDYMARMEREIMDRMGK